MKLRMCLNTNCLITSGLDTYDVSKYNFDSINSIMSGNIIGNIQYLIFDYNQIKKTLYLNISPKITRIIIDYNSVLGCREVKLEQLGI